MMNRSKFLLFVFLGIVFWLNGVLIVRLVGAHLLTEGNPGLFLAFLIAIPVTLITLYVTKLISTLEYSQLLRPIVIMTFTATTCDAIAFTWFRSVYSESYEIALYGAALILWGAGLGLMLAYYFDSKATS